MPKFFVKENQIKNQQIHIIGQDVNHIKNVLRLNIGEQIQICNVDTGTNYVSEITQYLENEIICDIVSQINQYTEPEVSVDIFQGLPKADKMELIIQKSIELGVHNIYPVNMNRCVCKLDKNQESKKIERWQKISETASKQSGRNYISKINNVINIQELCELVNNYDVILLTYENEKINTLKQELKLLKKANSKIGIVIGPEGGFEEKEVELLKQSGAKVITLGDRILRTETVALAVLSVIMYELGDFGGLSNEKN